MTNKQYLNSMIMVGTVFLSLLFIIYGYEPYKNLWLLPAAYLIVFIFFWRFKRNKEMFSSSGDLLFKVAVTIRYILIPTLMIINGDGDIGFGSAIGIGKHDYAIFYMVYELVIINVIYYILLKRPNISIIKGSKISSKNNILIFKLMVLISIPLLMIPEIRRRYSFFASSIVLTSRQLVSTYDSSYNMLFHIVNYTKIVIPIVIIVFFMKRYMVNPKTKYVVLSIFSSILPNMFYTATSRNSILIPMLAAFFTMLMVFNKHRKLILTIYGGGIVFIISVMTWFKSVSNSSILSIEWLVNYLSIYFLGPKEYAIGLQAIETYGSISTFETLINDIIGNIPGLSSFSNLLDRTSQLYNWTYYGGNIGLGGGYIIPASIQGAFHFGYVLGPLFTSIPLFLIRWSERFRDKNSNNISTVYIANYLMVSVSIYYANSVSSMMNMLFYIAIPLLLLNMIQRLLVRKK
jgi:hypothetical protein